MRRTNKVKRAVKIAATGLTGLYIAVSGIYMGVSMDHFLRRFQAQETCVTHTHAQK